ncbi:Eukaryotic translation initiation factor 4B1 [Bienertia sinuspersici]
MSKPWGGIGSWAAEAEREEAEERENASTTTTANTQSFPSLKEAITAKPKKKKMTLSEFASYGSSGGPISTGSTRLTPDEMLQLPTAPKPRTADDYSGGPRIGGGFSGYGDDRRSQRRGGFDDDRRQPRRGGGGDFDSMPPPPSRADEVDNWASMKKPMSMDVGRGVSSSTSNNNSSRYSALGGGSRADEVDNWNFGKKAPNLGVGGGRSSSFGSGFRDSGSDWRRERDLGGERDLGRTRLVLDPPTGIRNNGDNVAKPPMTTTPAASKANPFGAARPREEVLAEKGLDWKKLDSEIEAKKVLSSSGSRPTSSQGSRPSSSQSNRGLEGAVGVPEVKPKPKVNPFGDAKPREVLLEEKGLDWKKIDLDLEHRRVDRPETEEEKALKEEIESLKKELEKESGNGVPLESEGEQISLHDLVQKKEKDLEALTRELDDKVRFGQKAVDKPGSRPGSGAGRYTSFPERPPSQSGSFDDVRGPEVMDRPRSRGTGDVWTRPVEERRGGFQGGRDRGGFLGNRNFDRSTSRERW